MSDPRVRIRLTRSVPRRRHSVLSPARAVREPVRPALIFLASAVLCVGLFVHGLDGALGQALSCLLNSVTLVALLFRFRPSARFWRAVRWPALAFAAGIAWLLIVATVRSTLPVAASDLPYAQDLFLGKFLSVVAGLWALLIGAIVGWRSRDRFMMMDGIILFATLATASGLVLAWGPPDLAPGLSPVLDQGRFLGLASNANLTAAVCGAAAVLALARSLSILRATAGARQRASVVCLAVLYAAAAAINCAGLLLTASRLAALVTLVAMILLTVHDRRWSRVSRRRIGLPVALLGALVLLPSIFLSDRLVERIATLGPEAAARWTFWSQFSHIAAGAPWTGYGPGAFAEANLYFLRYSNAAARDIWAINSPHSIFLQLWLVGGAPYVLLMLGGAALIFRQLSVRRGLWREGGRHAALVLASGIVMAVGVVDITLDVPASAGITFLLAGLAWGGVAERHSAEITPASGRAP